MTTQGDTADRSPRYADGFATTDVSIVCPFDEAEFYVGAIAARSKDFVRGQKTLNQPIIVGAASGVTAEQVRLRALGEFVERVSATRAGSVFRGIPLRPREESDPAQPTRVPIGCAPEVADQIHWTHGADLATGRPVMLPAELCYLQFPSSSLVETHHSANGLAAHHTQHAALNRAILEAIERHQLMGSWHLTGWHVTELTTVDIPDGVKAACEALGRTHRLFELRQGMLPVVTLALVAQTDGAGLTAGSSCGGSAKRRADHAVSEALMLQHSILNTRAGRTGHEASRRSDLLPRNSMEHVLRYFDDGQEVIAWYERQARMTSRGHGQSPPAEAAHTTNDLTQAIRNTLGSNAFAAMVSDERAQRAGWHVYRALIPGALAYQPQHLPDHLLTSLDLLSSRVGHTINPSPHPFG
ncbi:YcaO-like family protein [Streptomyces sp. NPDC093108]|uniref:YcaO-like family protein n=1 Tax=Streptomyces sp. NPDC093108 TaxID=3366030 RepID=UPI003820E3A8